MIVRISRATVHPNCEAPVFEALRKAVAAGPPGLDGLEAFYITRHAVSGRNEVVAISVWRDTEALAAAMGPEWHKPAFLPSIDALLDDASVEHLESIAEEIGLLAGAPGTHR
jgi:hypothetical protein